MFTVDGGESWSGIDLPYETDPTALACPTEHVCIGVDQAAVPDGGTPARTPLVAFLSSARGDSFTRVVIPGSTANFGIPLISCSSPDECVIVFSTMNESGSAGQVFGYKTMDGGQSWMKLTIPKDLTDLTDIKCAPETTSCVASGESNGAFGLFGFALGPP